jgi:single-strand DNA-binding protein
MLNRIVLVGRLTKDPELRYTPANGVAVTSFTLAVNRRFKSQGQPDADFVPIVVWKQQAENCAKYLGKGSLVGVDGRLQIRSYEDREGQRKVLPRWWQTVCNSWKVPKTGAAPITRNHLTML